VGANAKIPFVSALLEGAFSEGIFGVADVFSFHNDSFIFFKEPLLHRDFSLL